MYLRMVALFIVRLEVREAVNGGRRDAIPGLVRDSHDASVKMYEILDCLMHFG